MGGSSSINTMPMATGKLSSSAQSSTPPIGSNPAGQTYMDQQRAQQGTMAQPGGSSDFYNRQISPEQRAANNASMADGTWAAQYQQATGQPLPQQVTPNWGAFITGQGPLLQEGQTYQMTPDQMRRQQMRDQINQQAGYQPLMQTYMPQPRQATGKGVSTGPMQGPINPADVRSFQRTPTSRAPNYDWARITGNYGGYGGYNPYGGYGGYNNQNGYDDYGIINANGVNQNPGTNNQNPYSNNQNPNPNTNTINPNANTGTNAGGGFGSAGYINPVASSGGGAGGISGRNDGENEVERAYGGRTNELTPEEILELARKIINERG